MHSAKTRTIACFSLAKSLYLESGASIHNQILKGRQSISWLLSAKRKARKANPQEEELRLLRQILAELQRFNASLGANRVSRQAEIEPGCHLITIPAMKS
jgi:hypothetical protein